jgi:hypothetical protein
LSYLHLLALINKCLAHLQQLGLTVVKRNRGNACEILQQAAAAAKPIEQHASLP